MAFKVGNLLVLAALAVLSVSASVLGSEEPTKQQKITTAETGGWGDRDRLLQRLFETYNKDNYPDDLKVEFGLSIIQLDVDELERNLDTNVFIKQVWRDDRLIWNPQDFGGHTVIRVPTDKLWTPDVVPYNSHMEAGRKRCAKSNALLYSSGKILTVTNCHEMFYCNLTLDRDPYGEQECILKYGSWTFDGYGLDLQLYNNETRADISDIWDTTDWQVTGTHAVRREKYYPCCKEPYPSIEVRVNFSRKGGAGTRSCDR